MTPNQKVNVTGTLSLGQKELKKVLVKSIQQLSFVKEDCILEDSTGHTYIHIWSPLITKLKNNYSYRLSNLTVKNFQGNSFLSASPLTTYSQQEKTLSSLKGPEILETPEKEIFVASFKLVRNFPYFCLAKFAKKRITDVCGTSVKCPNCSTHQKIVDCKREASAKVCVTNEGADLWLTIFSNTPEHLLQQLSSVTLQNNTEEVAETLLSASNILITLDPQTNVVSKMQHILSSHNQTSGKLEPTDDNRASQTGNGGTDDNCLNVSNDNDETWLDAIDDNTAPDDSLLDAI